MTWQTDGVTTTVEVSTAGQFITPRTTVYMPFTAGGDRGQPSGWTAYQENIGSPIWAQMSMAVTSDGDYSIESNQTNNRKDIPYGAKISIPVTPGHTYLVLASAKVKEGFGAEYTGPKLTVSRYAGGTFRQGISNTKYQRTGLPDQTNVVTLGVQQTFAADEGTMEISVAVNNTGKSPYNGASPDYGVVFSNLYYMDVSTPATGTDFAWRPIVCDTMDVGIRYGRARFTERYNVGTFSVRLNNVSGAYMYSETHPFGFRPGRLVRMRATYKGTTYPLCFGVIDRIATVQNPDGTATVTLTVFDTSSFTSDIATPSIYMQSAGSLTPLYSGVRIKGLLNYVGIPSTAQQVDTGLWGMQQIDSSNRTIREEIGVTADSEGGAFYGERDGSVVYKDRSWSERDPHGNTVQANITAFNARYQFDLQPDDTPTDPNAPIVCPFNMDTDWSLERVINYIRLSVSGGSPYVFENKPSQAEHGVRTYQRLDFLNSDITASTKSRLQIRADDIFSTSLDALLRVQRLAFRPTASTWVFALTAFLNWLVRVFYYNDRGEWGFSTVVRIQSVTHRITPTDWVVEFDVDQPIEFSDGGEPLPEGGWDTNLWDVNTWDEASGEIVPAEGAYWNSGQTWNGLGTTWIGRGWSSGIAKWSNADDDWKP